MLDIQYIRQNKEKVAEAIKNKNVVLDLELLLAKDAERVKFQQEIEELQSLKNDINDLIQKAASEEERKEIIEKGKEIKKKLEEQEPPFNAVKNEFEELMNKVPNIPSDDTPVGKDETSNQVLRKVGEPKKFDFQPKEHWQIGEALGLIDMERAAKVSGARFVYLKGDLVLLEFALMQFALSVLTSEKKLADIIAENQLKVPAKPFTPVLPPVLIRPEMMMRMARLDPEEMYSLERDHLNLIGSAEHTLGAMYADEVLDEGALPLRLVGYSVAFRREAGSYGKDMKGFLRMHQFNKLEMESFTVPEQSRDEQDFIVAIQEYLLKKLEIPYQVVAVSTGDMGKPDIRQIDLEAWMPGQNRYRETNTADLIGDFQARRLGTKFRRADGKTEYVHMNDATAFSQRPLIAILENCQQADGSILIPEILRPYMGKDAISLPKAG